MQSRPGQKFLDSFFFHNHRMRNIISVPFMITLLCSALLALFAIEFRFNPLWINWEQATGNATHFCELNRFGFAIVQPSNTWSNLGFLFAALIILSIAIKDHQHKERLSVSNYLANYPGFSFLFGFSVLYMFIGSFFYHASLTKVFQKMDQVGMYFVMTALLGFVVYRMLPKITFRGKTFSTHKPIIVVAIIVDLIFNFFLWKININILFPTFVIVFFAINILSIQVVKDSRPIGKYLHLGIVSFLTGATIWIMDMFDVICIPTSVFQGHALWHLLDATAIIAIYFYFRSENYRGFFGTEEVLTVENE